jgi:hypothetical protein
VMREVLVKAAGRISESKRSERLLPYVISLDVDFWETHEFISFLLYYSLGEGASFIH